MSALFDDAVATVLFARPRDVDGFTVGRVLPAVEQRSVGPFIFFDHMGPASVPAGRGLDVRPHPHIGLATVTALFSGEIVHRDSLGNEQVIRPGEVNWMIAGRGIVHSERTSPERRATGQDMHGLQLWVALPDEHEEDEPEFAHHPAVALPPIEGRGYRGRVLAGTAFGLISPVAIRSPMFYVQAEIETGGALPVPDEYRERAVYLASGRLEIAGRAIEPRHMVVLRSGVACEVRATEDAQLVLLGGEPVGPRHVWWNLVSSRASRIAEAAAMWREERFPLVPGDEVERIPLPETLRLPAPFAGEVSS
jgi:redox-sensitive bicupin YhaK (pirin superfamily)